MRLRTHRRTRMTSAALASGLALIASLVAFVQAPSAFSSSGEAVAAAAAEGAQLTGTFTNFRGSPLSDIEVTRYVVNNGVAVPDGAPVVTSSRGFYLMDVSAGTYRVCFRDLAGEYYTECWENQPSADQARDITVTDGAVATTDAILTLVGHGSVTGRVLPPAGSGIAVTNMGLELRDGNDGGYSVAGYGFPDTQGRYRMDSVPAGTYLLLVGGNDVLSAEYLGDAFSVADATRVVVAAGEETALADAQLETRPHVAGRVVNQAGQPLDGVVVRAIIDRSLVIGGGPPPRLATETVGSTSSSPKALRASASRTPAGSMPTNAGGMPPPSRQQLRSACPTPAPHRATTLS